MRRVKSLSAYEKMLCAAILERKGECNKFLVPQIKLTATNWQAMEQVTDKLRKEDLTLIEYGRNGQRKKVLNPLAVQQNALFKTLCLNFKALGLTYDIIPDKIAKETNKKKEEEESLLLKMLRS